MEETDATGTTDTTTTDTAGETVTDTQKQSAQSAQSTTAAQATQTSDGGTATTTTQEALTAWKPNFKFKVKDKEHEIDDLFKPLIKDAATEKKIKEIHERSFGLDEIKGDRQTLREERDQLKQKFSGVEQSLQALGDCVKKKDYRTFFEALSIPKQDIIQYAIEELKYQELPPEQRAAIEEQRQQQSASAQYAQQNQQLQKQMETLVMNQAAMELNQELTKPDVSLVAAAYDTRLGAPGSFRAEVIRRGQYYEAVHKVSPPVGQLVKEVSHIIGVQTATPAVATQGTPGQVASIQSQKPVISGFTGSGTKSPTRKVPTSIDDLRKMRQDLTT